MKINKIWNNKATTYILLCLDGILLLLLLLLLYFERTALYLYGNVIDSNGKLATLIISIIGGGCVIYGLVINNKRVKEQTRQNDISIQNNNDKRFGEAIGYLNNDNKGIVIGGIYSLYQLAQEDMRYAPIITNIFINYINANPKTNESSIMVDLLFAKINNPFVFNKDIEFNDLNIKNKTLYCKDYNVTFKKCSFVGLKFIGKNSIKYNCCNLNELVIFGYEEVVIKEGNAKYIKVLGNKTTKSIISLEPDEIFHSKFYFKDVVVLHIDPKNIENVMIYASYIYDLYISNNFKIVDGTRLFINSPKIDNIKNKHVSGTKDGTITIFNKENTSLIEQEYEYYSQIISKGL